MADSGLIPASDYTKVVDKVTGQELPDPIPKSWVGTDLAPDVKAKAGKVTAEDFTDDNAPPGGSG